MRVAVLITVLLTTTTSAAAFADAEISHYVKEHVRIVDCNFSSDFVASTLSLGLGRIKEVNPDLAQVIRTRSFGRDLKVYCDQEKFPFYKNGEIHLFKKYTDGGLKPAATLFHEFLHVGGWKHIPLPADLETEAFAIDPVYACHLTGFPELDQVIGLRPGLLNAARDLCGRSVHPSSHIRNVE